MQKYRNKQGNTLAIVGVSMLVIVLLGIAFYFFSRMFGAGKEVADGVDGGAIGVAKQASKQLGVSLVASGTSDPNDIQQFLPLTDPPAAINNGSTNINVLTYNRLVAQAMLVSINAKAMGTSQAATNALNVWNSVKYVGQQLTTQLNNANNFQNSFNIIANRNNTSLFGINNQTNSSKVEFNAANFKVGYMRNGGASNVYIPQDLINNFNNPSPDDAFSSVSSTILPALTQMLVSSPGNTNAGSLTFPVGSSSYGVSLTGAPASASGGSNPGFLAGYTDIPQALSALPNYPGFVPVLPGNSPHLVSKLEFNSQTSASPANGSNSIPPNAYQSGGVTTQRIANTSNTTIANAIACSVVGCPTQSISGVVGSQYNAANLTTPLPNGSTSSIQTLANQYPMSIPGGYIRLDNLPGLSAPPGAMVTNGTNDIFNNQLYYNGIAQANTDSTGNGVYSASAEGDAIVNAWATYNNGVQAALAAGVGTAPSTSMSGSTGTAKIMLYATAGGTGGGGGGGTSSGGTSSGGTSSGGTSSGGTSSGGTSSGGTSSGGTSSGGTSSGGTSSGGTSTTQAAATFYPPSANAQIKIGGNVYPASQYYPPLVGGVGVSAFACTPGNIDSQSGEPYMIYGTQGPATLSNVMNITSYNHCQTPANYPAGGASPNACGGSNLATWQNYFSANSGTSVAQGNNLNPVEYLKGYMLVQRGPECGDGLRGVSLSNTSGGSGGGLNGTTTGMHLTPMTGGGPGVLQQPLPQPTQNNHNGIQYSIPGNPIQLLTAVGNPTGKALHYTTGGTGLGGAVSMKQNSLFDFLSFTQPAYAITSGAGPGSSVTTVSSGSASIVAGTALYNIYQRCREIKPGVTPDEVINALDTSVALDMGMHMYLYLNPTTGMFTCDAYGPQHYYAGFSSAYSDQATADSSVIDGTMPTGSVTVSNLANNTAAQQALTSSGNAAVYETVGTLVDTKAVTSTGQETAYPYPPSGVAAALLGDAEYHDQPFTQAANITAMDAAVWVPCSGYHNLLGIVQFQTTIPTTPTNINLSNNPSSPNPHPTNPGGYFSAPN